MIISVCLVSLILTLLAKVNYIIRKKKVTPVLFIIIMYLFSIVLSIFIDNTINYSLEASCYFLFILLCFIVPLMSVKTITKTNTLKVNEKVFKAICLFFIFSSFICYFYFLPIIIKHILSEESFLVLRARISTGTSYIEAGPIYYYCSIISQFYPIILIFYFYSLSYFKFSNKFNNLLLFSSTTYILNTMTALGREGVIFWILSYLFAYLLLRNCMDEGILRKEQRKIKINLILLIMLIVPITISRFLLNPDPNSVGLLSGLLGYFVQQFGNFNTLYESVNVSILEVNNIGAGVEQSFLDKNELYKRLFDIDINVFYSFIGDFYLKVGKVPLLVISLFYSLFSLLLNIKRNNYGLGNLMVYTLFAQIPLHGLFYFKLDSTVSQIYIVVVFLMSCYLNKKSRKSYE